MQAGGVKSDGNKPQKQPKGGRLMRKEEKKREGVRSALTHKDESGMPSWTKHVSYSVSRQPGPAAASRMSRERMGWRNIRYR